MFTGKKESDTDAVEKTRKTQMRNTRKNSVMWEQVEREEQSGGHGGNLEAVEEEKEDEDLDSPPCESHQPRLVTGVALST